MTRERRLFSSEFKLQMVRLYENGKPRNEIIREYDLTPSPLGKWIKQYQNTGTFNHQDNLSDEEKELIKLRKEVQHLKMENDIFKASSVDHGTKIEVIQKNAHQYSVSAMGNVLKILRSTYYDSIKRKDNKITKDDSNVERAVINIFNANRKVFATRRIKNHLNDKGHTVSRRKIGRIMKKYNLVSVYTKAKYKNHPKETNEKLIKNHLNRAFNREQPMETLVSDLTYVKVAGTWHYICLFIDLFNREIVGYSAGKNKDANLVSKAISRINHNLEQIKLFHTDRGKEFDNHLIDEVLETFKIKRSLSTKGCPYDNAVAEATMKAMKTEFVKQMQFENLEQLKTELFDYVNWYNNFRPHSSLQYLTPVAFKNLHMKTV
ncbi:IS3 family transposase [Staphylococcus aureus]|uniref:IS3 family transposase n=1 Tax=Staphylococcus TaxID=1279 RepID=UPI000B4BF241|nr:MULTISPECIES: IS3 family transposase [Staphylococcus]HDK9088347.1 IS3 family transposase [Staphylococcus aureus USA200-NRS383]HDK9250490.1 IS3 family transposase [Staphylococcus aureus USA200-OR-131]HDK9404485.1 IS3 family transposase [Staphylococcus aureus USA1100-04031]AUU47163.1 DDE domain-containing protein [Staphylococcus aureus]AUU62991.1 DDE domain-containing protein [Staphylococcus aureus]